MENIQKQGPKGSGEAAHSAPQSNRPEPNSGPNGPNSGRISRSRRKQKAQERAEAFSANGNASPPFSPRCMAKFPRARNGTQETRPRSPASLLKSRDCRRQSPTAEKRILDREDSPRQRGRTKEGGEDLIRPAGSRNRGRGMRAPDGPGPRALTTVPVTHALRSEENRVTVGNPNTPKFTRPV